MCVQQYSNCNNPWSCDCVTIRIRSAAIVSHLSIDAARQHILSSAVCNSFVVDSLSACVRNLHIKKASASNKTCARGIFGCNCDGYLGVLDERRSSYAVKIKVLPVPLITLWEALIVPTRLLLCWTGALWVNS